MASTAVAEINEFRAQLEARSSEFANALPSHIRPEYFQRATLTAIQQNPELLGVDRRSLLNALMRCAADGLVPDGRQAAMVIFRDRERGKVAQYMQMVAGVRLLVQQSGEISRFEQVVVHQNDEFSYALGDRPHIHHVPAIDDRGPPVLVYSIAQFRGGGLSREVMTVEEIEKVRGVSRAKDGGPWRDWWSEMAKKTIAKRHAKVLPMSSDAALALARDDAEHAGLTAPAHVVDLPTGRPRLAGKLDAISQAPQSADPPTPRRRGRPRKPEQAAIEHELPPPDDPVPDIVELDLGEAHDDGAPDDAWPGPRPDFEQGVTDASHGRASCLMREIRDDPARLAEWTQGFNSVKAKRRSP